MILLSLPEEDDDFVLDEEDDVFPLTASPFFFKGESGTTP